MRPPVEDSATTTVSPRSFRRRAMLSARAIRSCITLVSLVELEWRSANLPVPTSHAYDARKRARARPPADKSNAGEEIHGEKARGQETQHDQAAVRRHPLRGEGSGRVGDHQPAARAQRVPRADAR